MASVAEGKWDRASGGYDLFSSGAEKRWEQVKRESLSKISGRVLFLAMGTGLEVRFFPPMVEPSQEQGRCRLAALPDRMGIPWL